MVLGVLVVELQRVVVDVRDRRDGDAVEAEPLELEAGHRARSVLEEDLVDAQLDLLVRAAGEVFVDDLRGERASGAHGRSVVPGRDLLRSARGRTLRPPRGDRAPGAASGRRSGGRRPRRRRDRLRASRSSRRRLPAMLGDLSFEELWPFFVIGLLVPGLSQILFVHAVRGVGAARTAILVGTGTAGLRAVGDHAPRRAAAGRPRGGHGARGGRRNRARRRTRAAGGLPRVRCSCSRSFAPCSSACGTTSCGGRTKRGHRCSRQPRCRCWPRRCSCSLCARRAPRRPRSPAAESPRRRSRPRESRSAWPTPP